MGNLQKDEFMNGSLKEHCHFGRMFQELKETFRVVAMQEAETSEQFEILETAVEDLNYLIQEMIAHFEMEENAYSAVIVKYPEFESKIVEFQRSHDRICSEFCKLERKLSEKSAELPMTALGVYEMVRELKQVIDQHTHEESELLKSVFDVMNDDDCKKLQVALQSA